MYALQLTVNYNVYISGDLYLSSTAESAGLLSWSTSSSDKFAAGRELASITTTTSQSRAVRSQTQTSRYTASTLAVCVDLL